MRAAGLALSLLLLGTGTGCMKFHGNFSVLSNRLVRTADVDLASAERRKGIVGKDVMHIIVFIPTQLNVTLDAAIDEALDRGDGDVMTNARVHYWWWYLPCLYGQAGWSVEGNVVNTRRKRPASPAPGATPTPKDRPPGPAPATTPATGAAPPTSAPDAAPAPQGQVLGEEATKTPAGEETREEPAGKPEGDPATESPPADTP